MDLLINKSALAESKLADMPLAPLAEGEARMRVDLFSLTANNVTYGAMGDFLKYWNFYPTADAGWGRVPVWGFATAIESRSPSVAVGERVYGYLPMSDTFTLTPGERKHGSFAETAPHRAGLAPVYNSYVLNAGDPLYAAETEALQVLFRPLFTTSFLIDDFIAEAGYFGAKQVIFSSASAKTAYAAAQLMKARGDVKVIGLTSPSNVAYTKELGFYDEVIAYDGVAQMDGSAPSVFIDIAGNAGVREAVHSKFADKLTYSCGGPGACRPGAEDVLCAGCGPQTHHRLGPRRVPAEALRSVARLPADCCAHNARGGGKGPQRRRQRVRRPRQRPGRSA